MVGKSAAVAAAPKERGKSPVSGAVEMLLLLCRWLATAFFKLFLLRRGNTARCNLQSWQTAYHRWTASSPTLGRSMWEVTLLFPSSHPRTWPGEETGALPPAVQLPYRPSTLVSAKLPPCWRMEFCAYPGASPLFLVAHPGGMWRRGDGQTFYLAIWSMPAGRAARAVLGVDRG